MSVDKTQLVKELRKTIKELAEDKPEAFEKNGDEVEDSLTFLKKKAYKLLKQITE